MKNKILILLIPVCFILFLPASARNIHFTGGLSTLTFVGDNPATHGFVHDFKEGADKDFTIGGSFQETQRGIDLRADLSMTEDDKWRIPVGFNYIFCRSREMRNYRELKAVKAFNTDILSLYSGVHYCLWKYPVQDISVYAGAEVYGSYFTNIKYEIYFKDGGKELDREPRPTKDNAFRIGSALRLGGEGKVYKDVYLSWGVGLHCMNLLIRDEGRGELMTPSLEYEYNYEETFLFGYSVNIGALIKL